MDAAYAFGNHRNIDCCFAKATCSLHALPSFEMPIQIARFKSARCFFLSSTSDTHTSKTSLWTEFLCSRGFICCLTHQSHMFPSLQWVGSARHKELILQVLYKDLATNAAHRRASYVVEAALNNCSPQDGGKMEKRGGWDDSLTVMNAFPQWKEEFERALLPNSLRASNAGASYCCSCW